MKDIRYIQLLITSLELNIFKLIEKRSEYVFNRFNSDFDPIFYQKAVELVRILFSVIMLYRYIITFDSAPLFDFLPASFPQVYIIFYIFLLIGFITPLTLIVLVFFESFSPLFIAVKVNSLLPLILLFLGSGRIWSVDGKIFKRILSKSCFKGCQLQSEDFPSFRTYLLIPYGLICLLAFIGHIKDPAWQDLEAVRLILQNPVVTSAPDFLRKMDPLFYKAGAFIQLIWELGFLLMILFPSALAFGAIYGLFFFITSIYLIHLSFLGHLEILLWILIFHQELRPLLKRFKFK